MIRGMMCFCGLLVALAQQSKAGFEFFLDTPASYSAGLAGTSVTADLYLRATPTDTLQSATSLNYQIVYGAGGTTFNAAGFTINAAFNSGTNSVVNIANGISIRQTNNAGVGAVSNQVLLGNLTLTLGQSPSSTVLDYDPVITGGGSNIAASFNNGGLSSLDSSGVFNSSSTVNVAAVPEPSSLMLLGCLGAVATFKRRRRA